MPEDAARPSRRDWIRALLGPAALVVVGASQAVRVTGPLTVALTHPQPPVTLAVADVLAVLALSALALSAASSLCASRPPMIRLALAVAASQLPMALVALLVGRTTLGRTIVTALHEHGERLMTQPTLLLQSLGVSAACVLVLTAFAVGILLLGYERATQARGWRMYASFAVGLIAAELVCRLWSRFTG